MSLGKPRKSSLVKNGLQPFNLLFWRPCNASCKRRLCVLCSYLRHALTEHWVYCSCCRLTTCALCALAALTLAAKMFPLTRLCSAGVRIVSPKMWLSARFE